MSWNRDDDRHSCGLVLQAIRQISGYLDELCMRSIEQRETAAGNVGMGEMMETGEKMQPTAISLEVRLGSFETVDVDTVCVYNLHSSPIWLYILRFLWAGGFI